MFLEETMQVGDKVSHEWIVGQGLYGYGTAAELRNLRVTSEHRQAIDFHST
jgi:hypothetical protein